MDFGSKFVYIYPESEEETYSDTEFDSGFITSKSSRPSLPSPRPTCSRSGGARSAHQMRPPLEVSRCKNSIETPDLPGRSQFQKIKNLISHREKKPKKSDDELKKKKRKPRRARRADTNVISVKFGHLISPNNMHTGDPVYCNSCGAVLSHISSITIQSNDKCWTCEFCNGDNIMDVEDDEKPKTEDVTFMLKPALTTLASGLSGVDRMMMVVFCIDVSGSMCVTTEIPGKHSLRGSHIDHLQSLNTHHESQYLPQQQRNVTFVSRLQSVQAAVDSQICNMVKEYPDRSVRLVTFNNEVTVVGVGGTEDAHFSGDKLQRKEEMIAAGEKLALPQTVKITQKELTEKLYNFEEGGQTALGPALLLSIAMASQVKGSKVIICTDGMANTGIGNLDVATEEEFSASSKFYDEVSQLASDKGVSISLITIKGTECKLAELGKITVNTGGQVNIVDPLKLTEEFGNILADTTIATNVQATIILHKGLYFRNEDDKTSKVIRQIGNVTKDTEVTFEYGIKKSYRNAQKATCLTEPEDEKQGSELTDKANQAIGDNRSQCPVTALKLLPFQLQLVYTDMEGAEAMRVLTRMKPVTSDRIVAEKEMNAELIGIHGVKQSANLALDGCYTGSRIAAFRYRNILRNNLEDRKVSDVFQGYLKVSAPVITHAQIIQESEIASNGATLSDSEEDTYEDEKLPGPSSEIPRPMTARLQQPNRKALRNMSCPDTYAHDFYTAQKLSMGKMLKKKDDSE